MEIAKNMVEYYKKQEFEKFGIASGLLIRQMSTPTPIPMLGSEEKGEVKKAAAQLIQGMMKGMDVGTFNFTNLLICIYEADQDAELVYAVTQIEQDAIADKSIVEGAMGVFFAYGAY